MKVSFDISSIHVVVAERCCKRGISQTLLRSGISYWRFMDNLRRVGNQANTAVICSYPDGMGFLR